METFFCFSGVHYIGRSDKLADSGGSPIFSEEMDKNFQKSPSTPVFVYYWKGMDVGGENHILFNKLIELGKTCLFVDLMAGPELPETIQEKLGSAIFDKDSRVVKFFHQEPISLDCLKDVQRKRTICLARPNIQKQNNAVINTDTSSNLLEMEAPCPQSFDGGICPSEDNIWECDNCGKTLRFDKDKMNDNLNSVI